MTGLRDIIRKVAQGIMGQVPIRRQRLIIQLHSGLVGLESVLRNTAAKPDIARASAVGCLMEKLIATQGLVMTDIRARQFVSPM